MSIACSKLVHSVRNKYSEVHLVTMSLSFSESPIYRLLYGTIDAKFGYGTYWALRNFQEQYGLPVDGIAGETTKKKLIDVSNYDENFVKNNLKKGNKFTHYGGKPLDGQVTKGAGTKKDVQLPGKYSDQDLKLMSNAVYGEARGEPYEGASGRCGSYS